jgi:hypothetical protein
MNRLIWMWSFFLLLIGGITLWYAAHAAYDLHDYYSLVEAQKSSLHNVKVITQGNKYHIEASYSFDHKDASIIGQGRTSEMNYDNRWIAEQDLKAFIKDPFKVWYSPKVPSHSKLYKMFPYKDLIYSVILSFLFCYFLFLGYILIKRKPFDGRQ